jgi:hypothetical protein
MPKSNDNYGGFDVLSLSDPSLYRLLEQTDSGWREELPDGQAFRYLDAKPTRRQRIRQKFKTLFRKRRKHALQPA